MTTSPQTYRPWGQTDQTSPLPTQYAFTGQYGEPYTIVPLSFGFIIGLVVTLWETWHTMIRNTKLLPLLLGLIILLIICGSILLWTFWTPSNTPCTPISYPEGTQLDLKPSEVHTFETLTDYGNVVDFYRDRLILIPPQRTQFETVEWTEHSIPDKGVLFQCGSKLNSYELELGCIYVHEKEGNAVIDVTWSSSEGAASPCYILPEIEPEDYLTNP